MKYLLIICLFAASALAEDKIYNVSAYCLCKKCCEKDSNHPAYGVTASGYKVKLGDGSCLVAAPKNFRFGTMLRIAGYNNGLPVPVLDRGGAIKGNKLDLLFNSYKTEAENHRAALKWGRKFMVITEDSNDNRHESR